MKHFCGFDSSRDLLFLRPRNPQATNPKISGSKSRDWARNLENGARNLETGGPKSRDWGSKSRGFFRVRGLQRTGCHEDCQGGLGCHLVFQTLADLAKAARGHTSLWAERVALYKGDKNCARDLYRTIDLPLESGHGLKSACPSPGLLCSAPFLSQVQRFQILSPLKQRSKEPLLLTIPVKLPDGSHGETQLPLQLPHLVLDYLMQACGLALPDSRVRRFWQHMDSVRDAWALSTADFRNASESLVWPLGYMAMRPACKSTTHPLIKSRGSS